MAVVALVVFIVFTCSFAFSQPKRGKSFSPGRQKFNRACRLVLCGVGLISVAYLIYSIGWGTACGKYDVDIDVYAIELKTDGHRMLRRGSPRAHGGRLRRHHRRRYGKMERNPRLGGKIHGPGLLHPGRIRPPSGRAEPRQNDAQRPRRRDDIPLHHLRNRQRLLRRRPSRTPCI